MNLEQAFAMALAHHRAGRLAVAEGLYRQILAVHPRHTDTLHLLGVLAVAQGCFGEAGELIGRAIELCPDRADFHANLGVLLQRTGRDREAVASLARAAQLNPDSADAHMNLGNVLLGLARYDESIASSRRALSLRPDFPEAHNNLGVALSRVGQQEAAIASLTRAVELNPGYAQAHCNLGSTLQEEDRFEEAAACYERARALEPALVDALGNLGTLAFQRGEFEKAVDYYRQAIAMRGDHADAHWNLSITLLFLGRYEEGWREFEWRWRIVDALPVLRNFSAPQWEGEAMPGLTLLLHAEQGLGDAIQFARYLPAVRERAQAARLIVEVPMELTRLLAESGWDGVDVVGRRDWSSAHLPAFDRHLPMLSLPLVLGRYEPLRLAAPYLRADPALRAEWRTRFKCGNLLRVGLAWAGNRAHKGDARRSIPFEKLAPLLRVPEVRFYSLQIAPPAPSDPRLVDETRHIKDFADTAALVEELDLIISVDTAVAHLAGGLGRPVWLLLPAVPDWRWGPAGESTLWYPSMRLFRQPRMGAWEPVIEAVCAELEKPSRTSLRSPGFMG
jgi:tetratricopeptide (TPR) repeat protein